jgi:hypothetical protein
MSRFSALIACHWEVLMNAVPLGHTGIDVSIFCLGMMHFGKCAVPETLVPLRDSLARL